MIPFIFLLSASATFSVDPEVFLKAPQIIQRWGYPVEVHQVVTRDGYILELHRIPYGRTGFVFADAGFDVWLGNSRGNTYSKKHTYLPTWNPAYWMFSWDEMAKYDLPAVIDYILARTGESSIYYVGHSEGTLTLFALSSEDPSFGRKIKTFFALSPIGCLQHEGVFKSLLSPFALQTPLPVIQTEMFPASYLLDDFCGADAGLEFCNYLLSMFGCSYNKTRTPVYLAHFPSGTSNKNLIHWGQFMDYTIVPRKYDYGNPLGNYKQYSSSSPPFYDYNKVNIPTVLIYGELDNIAPKVDIESWLIPQISPVLKKAICVPNYNHMDFIWGVDAPEKVYKPIIRYIEEMNMIS